VVADQALGFLDAAIGAVGDVIPGGLGVFRRDGVLPRLPGQVAQPGFLPKPAGHRLRVAAQGQRRLGDNVEALADSLAPVGQGAHKALGHVVSVDMVDGLHTDVGQREFLAMRQLLVDGRVEVALRVERYPARPDDVPRVQARGREVVQARLAQQVGFDGRFLDAVLAEGPARLGLGRRHLDARPVHPDRAAMQEVLDMPAQRPHQVLGAFQGEADHVDHDIGMQLDEAWPKRAGAILGLAVERDRPHLRPGGVRVVRLPLAPADIDHLMPRFDQARDQVRAYMTAAANDNDPHHTPLAPGRGCPRPPDY